MEKNVRISPSFLKGQVQIPLSKSFLHRALICAALAGDMSLVDLGTDTLSEDISATRACLEILFSNEKEKSFDCGESGSTLRFLIPITGAMGVTSLFHGKGRLPERPLNEYKRILEEKGMELFSSEDGKYLPLRTKGQLLSGTFSIPGNVSSQYITGLLFSLPILDKDSEIILTSPLESEAYVDITISVLRDFSIQIEKIKNGYFIRGGQKYQRKEAYVSEADFSQAAFWLVLQYLGHEIKIENLPRISVQGDQKILEILAAFSSRREGAPIFASETVRMVKENGVEIVEVNVSQIPDLAPVLSVAAAATPGITRFTQASRLRIKECDRLSASCEMLRVLGIKAEEKEDSFTIYGKLVTAKNKGFSGGTIRKYNDHRMVMSGAVAAACAEGEIIIEDPDAIFKSYPMFFRDFQCVGGNINGFDLGK